MSALFCLCSFDGCMLLLWFTGVWNKSTIWWNRTFRSQRSTPCTWWVTLNINWNHGILNSQKNDNIYWLHGWWWGFLKVWSFDCKCFIKVWKKTCCLLPPDLTWWSQGGGISACLEHCQLKAAAKTEKVENCHIHLWPLFHFSTSLEVQVFYHMQPNTGDLKVLQMFWFWGWLVRYQVVRVDISFINRVCKGLPYQMRPSHEVQGNCQTIGNISMVSHTHSGRKRAENHQTRGMNIWVISTVFEPGWVTLGDVTTKSKSCLNSCIPSHPFILSLFTAVQ